MIKLKLATKENTEWIVCSTVAVPGETASCVIKQTVGVCSVQMDMEDFNVKQVGYIWNIIFFYQNCKYFIKYKLISVIFRDFLKNAKLESMAKLVLRAVGPTFIPLSVIK